MSQQAYAEASTEEREHFIRCEVCTEWVDCRCLDEIFSHCTDHKPHPDIQYSGAKKVTMNSSILVNPKIVCLCGSSRFIEQVALKAWELEKQGVITLSMHLLPAGHGFPPHHAAENEGVAAILDQLHLRKIDLADEVLVMNVGGYIGERTKAEIVYAEQSGKPVTFLEPRHET